MNPAQLVEAYGNSPFPCAVDENRSVFEQLKRHSPFHVPFVCEMELVSKKSEDSYYRSPASNEAVQLAIPPSVVDDLENDISPESISAVSRKESHRASERVSTIGVAYGVEAERTPEREHEHVGWDH